MKQIKSVKWTQWQTYGINKQAKYIIQINVKHSRLIKNSSPVFVLNSVSYREEAWLLGQSSYVYLLSIQKCFLIELKIRYIKRYALQTKLQGISLSNKQYSKKKAVGLK